MMSQFLVLISFLFISNMATAADVVCSCTAPETCSDIEITFVPSNPGVYMTMEYANGEKTTEGFATITRDSQKKKTIYKLKNFFLVEENGVYTMPNRRSECK